MFRDEENKRFYAVRSSSPVSAALIHRMITQVRYDGLHNLRSFIIKTF